MASSNTVFHKDFDSCVSADRRRLCGGSYRCIQKEDTFGVDGGRDRSAYAAAFGTDVELLGGQRRRRCHVAYSKRSIG